MATTLRGVHPDLPTDRPFSTAMARTVGLSDQTLSRLVRSGVLRRLLRGVFVDAVVPDSLTLRCRALGLVLPTGTVVSDRTAAWLHGASILVAGDHLHVPPVSVVRIPDGNRLRADRLDGHRRMLSPDDVELVAGLPVTTALRTACDLGRLLRRDDAFAALDALLALGRFDRLDLVGQSHHERFKGFRGVRQLRELAPLADGAAESPKESILRLRWLDEGLPLPELQIPILDSWGQVKYRGDFGLGSIKLIIEFDGEEFHTLLADRAADARRRAFLRSQGWTVIVVRADELYRRNERIGRVLREAYERALHPMAA